MKKETYIAPAIINLVTLTIDDMMAAIDSHNAGDANLDGSHIEIVEGDPEQNDNPMSGFAGAKGRDLWKDYDDTSSQGWDDSKTLW